MNKQSIALGMSVRFKFGDMLTRTYARDPETGEWDFDRKIWARMRERVQAADLQDYNNLTTIGVIVGQRTLSNGSLEYSQLNKHTGVNYKATDTIEVALIAINLRQRHIKILIEDIEPTYGLRRA